MPCAVKGSFRFKREEHLTGRDKIKDVFGKGRRIGCRGAKLFVLKNDLPCNRICFTCARGFTGAVERNRAKRLGREAYRNIKPRIKCGYDMILLVYPDNPDTSYAGRAGQLEHLLSGAGLLVLMCGNSRTG
jgi:ribonuclease P protein component